MRSASPSRAQPRGVRVGGMPATAPRLWRCSRACLGAESQAAGRTPQAGRRVAEGTCFFSRFRSLVRGTRRATKPPTMTTITSGRLPPLRTLRCAPSNPLAARTWGWCQHVWSLGAGRGMMIAMSYSDGVRGVFIDSHQVLGLCSSSSHAGLSHCVVIPVLAGLPHTLVHPACSRLRALQPMVRE